MRLCPSLAGLVVLAVQAAACGSNLQPTHSIPATGGASGTGGALATGGTIGSTGGQGGGGPDSRLCGSLSASYQMALIAARRCDPGADAGGQCGALAWGALPVTGCPLGCDNVWVNDASQLTMIKLQWLEAGCHGPGACRVDSCLPLPAGQCLPVDGGQSLCQTLVFL